MESPTGLEMNPVIDAAIAQSGSNTTAGALMCVAAAILGVMALILWAQRK